MAAASHPRINHRADRDTAVHWDGRGWNEGISTYLERARCHAGAGPAGPAGAGAAEFLARVWRPSGPRKGPQPDGNAGVPLVPPRSGRSLLLLPGAGDQGQQGSCTAWAAGYAARAYYAAAVEQRRITSPQSIPSPAFIYGLIVADPNDCGSGSSNPLALEVLKQFGSLSLADYPYRDDTCAAPKLTPSSTRSRTSASRITWSSTTRGSTR